MPKFINKDVFNNGFNSLAVRAAARTLKLFLLPSYVQGSSYASNDAIKLASMNLTAGDFSVADYSTRGRQLTVAGKTGTAATAVTTPDLHIAVVDPTDPAGASVLLVTDETSDVDISVGNVVIIPSLLFQMDQPV